MDYILTKYWLELLAFSYCFRVSQTELLICAIEQGFIPEYTFKNGIVRRLK
jgi:hypothetical protein